MPEEQKRGLGFRMRCCLGSQPLYSWELYLPRWEMMAQLEFLRELFFFSSFHGSQIMGCQIRDSNIWISFALDFYQNGGRFTPCLCQSREDNVQGRPLTECVWKSPSTSLCGLDHTQNPMDCPKWSPSPSCFRGLWYYPPFPTIFGPRMKTEVSQKDRLAHAGWWRVTSGSPALRVWLPRPASPHAWDKFESLSSTAIPKKSPPLLTGAFLTEPCLNEDKFPPASVPQGCMISSLRFHLLVCPTRN